MHQFNMILGVTTVLAVLACYLSGVWALYGHFRTHGRIEAGMKATSLLSLAGMAWFLAERWHRHALTHTLGAARDGACLATLALFTALFWWTIAETRSRRLTLAFSKDQPDFLHSSGPYALVRHPFYTSYLLFWVAAAIGSGSLAYWLMPALMFVIYWRAIRAEEGKFAGSGMAAAYARYKARTGMLLPLRLPGRQASAAL